MNGHRVRIGQLGWNSDRAALTLDEVQCGIGVHWVEIDGQRYEHVVSAHVRAAKSQLTRATLVVQLVGPIELVYVDDDGNELGAREVEATPILQHGSILERA